MQKFDRLEVGRLVYLPVAEHLGVQIFHADGMPEKIRNWVLVLTPQITGWWPEPDEAMPTRLFRSLEEAKKHIQEQKILRE